jgi:hypothetical protein
MCRKVRAAGQALQPEQRADSVVAEAADSAAAGPSRKVRSFHQVGIALCSEN